MNGLEEFQEFGDTKSLLDFVGASGREVRRYQEAVAGLAPLFEGLSHSERPSYESLDKEQLGTLRPEIEQIVQWMCGSNKADIRTRAIELMGVLGYDSFLGPLRRYLFSEIQWERLTAIGALARMPGKEAAELLRAASKDQDPQVREEVRRVATNGGAA